MKADSGPGLNRKRRGQGRGLKRVWEGNDWMEQAAALRKVGRLLRRPETVPPRAVRRAGWSSWGRHGGRARKASDWHLQPSG